MVKDLMFENGMAMCNIFAWHLHLKRQEHAMPQDYVNPIKINKAYIL